MKSTAYLVLYYFLTLQVSGSRQSTFTNRTRIIGGFVNESNDFQYKVALIHLNGQYFCSGAVVDARVVLTAAHCMLEVAGQTGIYAIVGTNNIVTYDSTYQKIRSQNWIVHENYSRSIHFDLAVIKLETPIILNDYVSLLPLFSANETLDGYNASDCGWGIYEVYQSSSVLRCLHARIISNTECSWIYGNNIAYNFICAQGYNKSRTCNGDSGSALVYKTNRNTYVGVGILSFGPSDCSEAPVVFTRVSQYYAWIVAKVQYFINPTSRT